MKFNLRITCLIMVTLLMTGCLDILHTISLRSGQADITVRYTIQKAVFEMGASFSGEEPDYTEFSLAEESFFSEYEDGYGEVTPIDNSLHVGAELRITGSVEEMQSSLGTPYFLPIEKNGVFDIQLPSFNDGEEQDEMGIAFLSGAKYSLLIDLSGDLKDVNNVRLVVEGKTPEYEEPYSDIQANVYGSSILIEIPMILLFASPEDIHLQIF